MEYGKMNPDNFEVNFENGPDGTIVTATLKNSGYIYNDIYFKLDNVEKISVAFNNNFITDEVTKFYNIGNNMPIYLLNVFEHNTKKTIYFEVRNKVTGAVMVTKKYELSIRGITGGNNTTVDNGVINEGQDDEQIMTPDNDKNISSDVFFGLNENSSFDDILDAMKQSFETFKTAFSILPGFIWALIGSSLVIIIILRVLGR